MTITPSIIQISIVLGFMFHEFTNVLSQLECKIEFNYNFKINDLSPIILIFN